MMVLPEWKLAQAGMHYTTEEAAETVARQMRAGAEFNQLQNVTYRHGEAVTPEGRRVWVVWRFEGTGKYCPVCRGKGSLREVSSSGLSMSKPCYRCQAEVAA